MESLAAHANTTIKSRRRRRRDTMSSITWFHVVEYRKLGASVLAAPTSTNLSAATSSHTANSATSAAAASTPRVSGRTWAPVPITRWTQNWTGSGHRRTRWRWDSVSWSSRSTRGTKRVWVACRDRGALALTWRRRICRNIPIRREVAWLTNPAWTPNGYLWTCGKDPTLVSTRTMCRSSSQTGPTSNSIEAKRWARNGRFRPVPATMTWRTQ